jgi:hypothetical protein
MNSDESGLSDLQFDRAEPASSSRAAACASCHLPITDRYFSLNGYTLCPDCADAHRVLLREPSKRDLLRAAAYGSGAAIAGTALYFAILALTGYEIGLIAVAVGWMVGKAVQKGSRGLGGRKLQIMAVVLTYLSIVGSYVPLSVKYALEHPTGQRQSATASQKQSPEVLTEPTPPSAGALIGGLLMLLVYCLVSPFLNGLSSIIGLFIICIGLFEAWKLNRKAHVTLEGPFAAA